MTAAAIVVAVVDDKDAVVVTGVPLDDGPPACLAKLRKAAAKLLLPLPLLLVDEDDDDDDGDAPLSCCCCCWYWYWW